jgi:hypothetical protein
MTNKPENKEEKCNMHSIIENAIKEGRDIPKGLICYCDKLANPQTPSLEELRCNQCKLDGNNGKCDRTDCVGFTYGKLKWEEEIEKVIYKHFVVIDSEGTGIHGVIDFIKKVESQAEERGRANLKKSIREEIEIKREKSTGPSTNHDIHRCGYNDALDDILSLKSLE